jgi:hypothetical protein
MKVFFSDNGSESVTMNKKIPLLLVPSFLIPALLATVFAEPEIAIGKQVVRFSAQIPASSSAKSVDLYKRPFRPEPYEINLFYDTLKLELHRLSRPSTPKDTLASSDLGILSPIWGIKEQNRSRYLNLSDLKRIGAKRIDMDVINTWIIMGFEVSAAAQFREYYAELKTAGLVAAPLPSGFKLRERIDTLGYRYIAGTIFVDRKFIKYAYLVSPENDVMLVDRKVLAEGQEVELVPNPSSPGQFFLRHAADSTALRRAETYRDITDKYSDRLLE